MAPVYSTTEQQTEQFHNKDEWSLMAIKWRFSFHLLNSDFPLYFPISLFCTPILSLPCTNSTVLSTFLHKSVSDGRAIPVQPRTQAAYFLLHSDQPHLLPPAKWAQPLYLGQGTGPTAAMGYLRRIGFSNGEVRRRVGRIHDTPMQWQVLSCKATKSSKQRNGNWESRELGMEGESYSTTMAARGISQYAAD